MCVSGCTYVQCNMLQAYNSALLIILTSKAEGAECLKGKSHTANVCLEQGRLTTASGCESMRGGLRCTRVPHLLVKKDHVQHL